MTGRITGSSSNGHEEDYFMIIAAGLITCIASRNAILELVLSPPQLLLSLQLNSHAHEVESVAFIRDKEHHITT